MAHGADAAGAHGGGAVFHAGAPREEAIEIRAFSELDERAQKVALEAIENLNKRITTNPDPEQRDTDTWAKYTPQIKDRLSNCKNAKNTFFVAQAGEKTVGYVAFYTREDMLPYANQFLENDEQAYCSWTAVDEAYRKKGLATDLKLKIFGPETRFQAFKGHIKETNKASLEVLKKFAARGHEVEQQKVGHQFYYTVKRKTS